MDGATVTSIPAKASSSGNAQIFKVEGSATGIKEFQCSRSTVDSLNQSTHVGEYYKITYQNGSKIKQERGQIYLFTLSRPEKRLEGVNLIQDGTRPENRSVPFLVVHNCCQWTAC
jgi:filamentous hemagglutinin